MRFLLKMFVIGVILVIIQELVMMTYPMTVDLSNTIGMITMGIYWIIYTMMYKYEEQKMISKKELEEYKEIIRKSKEQ